MKNIINILNMGSKYKYHRAVILMLFSVFFSCSIQEKELCGSWGSILIENKAPLFSKTLPSAVKDQIVLTFSKDHKFTWTDKSEKLYISGNYRLDGDKIYFNIEKEPEPLRVSVKIQKAELIILTDDGFSFTFVKN